MFQGWYDNKEGTGDPVIDVDGNWLVDLQSDTTVYAKWKVEPSAYYAVSIYDILHEPGENDEDDPGIVDEHGNVMGLTFGPATGADYTKSFKSHTPTGTTTHGNAHRCVHNDDWNTIIRWNHDDPEVYEQCIAEGCTHTVELNLKFEDSPFNTNFSISKSITVGDGPSQLYCELLSKTGDRYQHLRWNPLNTGTNYGTNKEGWGASRIRAMLNGADSLTMKKESYSYYNNLDITDVEAYTADTCLLNAFPDELQNAIGKRKVTYDSVYNQYGKNNAGARTSNDKLWLFSGKELYVDSGSNNNTIRFMEGPLMKRAVQRNITTSSYALNKGYCWGGQSIASSGVANYWWQRSPYRSSAYSVYRVRDGGSWRNGSAYDYSGVAPGFSLAR